MRKFKKAEGVEKADITIHETKGFYKLKNSGAYGVVAVGEELTPTFDTENYGVIIIDRPSSNGFIQEVVDKNKTGIFVSIQSRIHNDAILATLTESLGSHVISVLKQYPERAAEYLRNWHTECRIYHDRCVVTRRGEVIAEGVF